MRPPSPIHLASQTTASRPSTSTHSSARQQKLTSQAFLLVAESEIVNGCSGFSGARNLTLSMPLSRESCRHSSSAAITSRSEEHTSELQSLTNLVCRLLLEHSLRPLSLHSFPTRRSSDLTFD